MWSSSFYERVGLLNIRNEWRLIIFYWLLIGKTWLDKNIQIQSNMFVSKYTDIHK